MRSLRASYVYLKYIAINFESTLKNRSIKLYLQPINHKIDSYSYLISIFIHLLYFRLTLVTFYDVNHPALDVKSD